MGCIIIPFVALVFRFALLTLPEEGFCTSPVWGIDGEGVCNCDFSSILSPIELEALLLLAVTVLVLLRDIVGDSTFGLFSILCCILPDNVFSGASFDTGRQRFSGIIVSHFMFS